MGGAGTMRMGRVVAGGIAGGIVAAAAVAVWVAAAFWNWSLLSSPAPGPGQKVFMYVVSPGMLGAATVPVSVALGAGRRRMCATFAFVAGGACFLCVAAVEEWADVPWQFVVAALLALPGVVSLVSAFGRWASSGRFVSVAVAVFAVGVIFSMVAVLTWGFAESVWFHAAMFFAAWVAFPVAAEAAGRNGGER